MADRGMRSTFALALLEFFPANSNYWWRRDPQAGWCSQTNRYKLAAVIQPSPHNPDMSDSNVSDTVACKGCIGRAGHTRIA